MAAIGEPLQLSKGKFQCLIFHQMLCDCKSILQVFFWLGSMKIRFECGEKSAAKFIEFYFAKQNPFASIAFV